MDWNLGGLVEYLGADWVGGADLMRSRIVEEGLLEEREEREGREMKLRGSRSSLRPKLQSKETTEL